MKATILSIAILCLWSAAYTQPPAKMLSNTESVSRSSSALPLFIINDTVITDMSYLTLNPNRIASIDILKDSATIMKYGEKARNGIVIIRTKEKTEYLDLDKILEQYHICAENKNLMVCIDNMQVKDRSKIITVKSDIIRIEVIKDVYWKGPLEPGPEETYINIVTNKGSVAALPH